MTTTYLKYVFAFVAIGGASIATCNWLVDPFSLFGSSTIAGFNRDKVDYLKYLRLTKAYRVIWMKPDTIVLGTSRTGRGLSSEHPAWGDAVVYNLAVPAGSMYESLRLLQHAHAAGGLRRVLLGLDFRLFNESYVNPAFSEDRLLVEATGKKNAGMFSTFLADLFGALMSMDALQSSVNTMRFQGWSAETLYPDGRWDRKSAVYRYRDAFEAYTRASMNRLSDIDGPIQGLEDFRQIIRFAHLQNIDLRVFVSPSHATHWLLVAKMGLWSRFQQLKRELVRINLDEARRNDRNPFPLWDFSGINSVSREPVPPQGEVDEPMRWFWESVHYKSDLGAVILSAVLSDAMQSELSREFGVNLNTVELETHLKNQTARLEALIAEETPEVRLVEGIMAVNNK